MSALQKRVATLENQAQSGKQHEDLQRALEWVRNVRATREDLQAIARGDWASVKDDTLRASEHPERWERAAGALLGAMYEHPDEKD